MGHCPVRTHVQTMVTPNPVEANRYSASARACRRCYPTLGAHLSNGRHRMDRQLEQNCSCTMAFIVAVVLAVGVAQAEYREDFTKSDGGWTGYYRYPQGHRMERGHRAKGCLYADSSARFSAPKALTGNLRERYGPRFALEFAISDHYHYGDIARLVVTSGDTRWQWNTDIDSVTGEWEQWTVPVQTDNSDGWTRAAGGGEFSGLWQNVTALEIIPSRGAGMHFDDVSCGPARLHALVPGIGLYSIPVRVTSKISYPRVPLDDARTPNAATRVAQCQETESSLAPNRGVRGVLRHEGPSHTSPGPSKAAPCVLSASGVPVTCSDSPVDRCDRRRSQEIRP